MPNPATPLIKGQSSGAFTATQVAAPYEPSDVKVSGFIASPLAARPCAPGEGERWKHEVACDCSAVSVWVSWGYSAPSATEPYPPCSPARATTPRTPPPKACGTPPSAAPGWRSSCRDTLPRSHPPGNTPTPPPAPSTPHVLPARLLSAHSGGCKATTATHNANKAALG